MTNTLVLPQHRPLVGSDLLAIQTKFGCQVDELLHAFKMSPNRWSQVSKKEATKQVSPNIELVARVYDKWPETWPIKPAPKLRDLMETLNITKIADLALFFGKDSITGSRWLQGEEASRESGRKVNKAGSHGTAPLVKLQTINLHKLGTLGKRDELVGLVNDVAGLRGIDDIWQRGSWVTDQEALLKNITMLLKASNKTISDSKNMDDVTKATFNKIYCDKYFEAYYGLAGNPEKVGHKGLYMTVRKSEIMAKINKDNDAIQKKYNAELAEIKVLEEQMKEAIACLEKSIGHPLLPSSKAK
jgi:hypothetical protein